MCALVGREKPTSLTYEANILVFQRALVHYGHLFAVVIHVNNLHVVHFVWFKLLDQTLNNDIF